MSSPGVTTTVQPRLQLETLYDVNNERMKDMRTLLDNSTLSAAFRSIGLIKNENRELFDLDVASLRVLIDTIILSDDIYILDNYKQEYSNERKSWLDHSDIHFQEINDKLDISMLKNARGHVANWKMTKHLGTELSAIFDDLSILFKHAWRNSESFLVLKALGVQDKYGSTITNALKEYLYEDPKELNKLMKISPKSYNKETLRVAQSMAWASIRTVYYREASVLLGAEYCPHPLRNIYNAKCILFDNHPYTRKKKLHSDEIVNLRKCKTREEYFEMYDKYEAAESYYHDINQFFKKFWTDCNEKDDNIFGVQTFDLEMPPFLAYVLKNSGDRNDVLKTAFKLREDRGVSALRKKLNYIYYECNEEQQAKELRKFIVELRELKKYMQSYLGYDREKVGIDLKIMSYDMTVPRFMTKPLYPFKPHLAFIRDVILELASASTMGRLLDKLWFARY